MLLQTLAVILLISPALLTDPTCENKLLSGSHTTDIYTKNLHWKEPKTSASGGNLQLECQTGFLQHELKDSTGKFTCTGGLYNNTYRFHDLLCRSDFHKSVVVDSVPANELKSTVLHCNTNGLKLFKVSRKLQEGGTKLLYWSCLDGKTMRPKFSMRAASSDKPRKDHNSREEDVWGFDGFGKDAQERQRLSQGYVKRQQQRRFTTAFSDKYNQGKQYPYYFNRGHLVAYRDFNDHEDQKTTVEYINAAPQWEILNEHSWSLVERESRSMLQTHPIDWEIYTGTYGVIQSPRGPLFAVAIFDDNGKFLRGQLPVPMLYWKLVYNIKDKTKSRAFVGVNNPELRTAKDIGPTYRLCQNPAWQGDEFKGFTYECPVEQFLAKLSIGEKIVK